MSARVRVEGLLEALACAYDRASWHGPNLRGSIRGIDLEVASWRPGPGRHNVWEIVVHAAYWKYAARRRIERSKKGTFPLKGSNWFERPQKPSRSAWQADLQLLESEHLKLLNVVEELSDERLKKEVGRDLTAFSLIQGVAFHDVYHAGQIRLLRRLKDGDPR